MKIPFYDINRQHTLIENDLKQAVLKVLHSGDYISGHVVEDFEKAFAQYLGARYAVAVNSGTAGLHLALLILGVKPGDEVIIPSFTFVATAEAILYCQAAPVFVDITKDTFTIDPEQIEGAISKKTVGIIPVHLFGHMADVYAIQAIARRYGLWIIEDACQAHGASYKGKKAGTFGDIGVFSFYPTKNLGGIGEGGAVITRSATLSKELKTLRSHGSEKRYVHTVLGYNYRLNEVQAAVLGVKLPFLDEWNAKRHERAQWYHEALSEVPLELPVEKQDYRHVYHQYVVRVDKRNDLTGYLAQQGIETMIHYPTPLHLQRAYKRFSRGRNGVTERAAEKVLSLPMHRFLTRQEVMYVADAIAKFYSSQ